MIMNTRIFGVAATIAMLGTVSAAHAATGNTSTAAGTASATIVAPIVLTHTAGASLNFGKFTTGTGGTVVVASSGTGSVTSDVGFVPGSATTADQFSLTGDTSRAFGITTTNGTISNGSKTMSFTTAPSSASGTTTTSGTYSFSVGGTLTVVGTETAGSYTGTYNATVVYQ
ncbi:DUF4402 domain-containing protein [Novosphingobium sp.]|uniref:DUF4402 domain-containing protein n=1 Tax=Novosphingobium sp. TaxID=1874826 RepID=UPI0033421A11